MRNPFFVTEWIHVPCHRIVHIMSSSYFCFRIIFVSHQSHDIHCHSELFYFEHFKSFKEPHWTGGMRHMLPIYHIPYFKWNGGILNCTPNKVHRPNNAIMRDTTEKKKQKKNTTLTNQIILSKLKLVNERRRRSACEIESKWLAQDNSMIYVRV